MSRDSFLIAQLSDIHCGSPFFDPQLLRHAVEEVRALAPDLVLIGGDLTSDGYAHEFRDAQSHLAPLLDAEHTCVVIPGNHDAKNVGYLHFTDSFGPGDVPGKGDRVLQLTGRQEPGDTESPGPGQAVTLVAMDSTKPDLAEGEINAALAIDTDHQSIHSANANLRDHIAGVALWKLRSPSAAAVMPALTSSPKNHAGSAQQRAPLCAVEDALVVPYKLLLLWFQVRPATGAAPLCLVNENRMV